MISTTSTADLSGPRILAVDDDPLIADLMEIVFDIYNPDGSLTLAHDAEEALELMAESEFDVLITDINLPGMSGIELIDRVRNEISTFPIVVHSGSRRDQIQSLDPDIKVVEKGRAGVKSLVAAVLAGV